VFGNIFYRTIKFLKCSNLKITMKIKIFNLILGIVLVLSLFPIISAGNNAIEEVIVYSSPIFTGVINKDVSTGYVSCPSGYDVIDCVRKGTNGKIITDKNSNNHPKLDLIMDIEENQCYLNYNVLDKIGVGQVGAVCIKNENLQKEIVFSSSISTDKFNQDIWTGYVSCPSGYDVVNCIRKETNGKIIADKNSNIISQLNIFMNPGQNQCYLGYFDTYIAGHKIYEGLDLGQVGAICIKNENLQKEIVFSSSISTDKFNQDIYTGYVSCPSGYDVIDCVRKGTDGRIIKDKNSKDIYQLNLFMDSAQNQCYLGYNSATSQNVGQVGAVCAKIKSIVTPVCGNGILEEGEECDDGNNIDCDGCSAKCIIEFCGDGIVQYGEQCDDGNNINGDGCSSNCMIEHYTPVCIDADFEYDINLGVCGVNCLSSCGSIDETSINVPLGARYEVRGQVLRGSPGQCQTNEDFYLEINDEFGPETVDDADPCAISVRIDFLGTFNFNSGWNDIIIHSASQCPPDVHANSVELTKLCLYYIEECGNGILDSGEQCDDGNNINGDGCSSNCMIEHYTPVCGNGILDSGEQCDDGNNINGDGCSSTCVIEHYTPVCGNGILDSGEQCDDGNNINGDGCSSTCVIESTNPCKNKNNDKDNDKYDDLFYFYTDHATGSMADDEITGEETLNQMITVGGKNEKIGASPNNILLWLFIIGVIVLLLLIIFSLLRA
jgi:cysteine-rich repeat protein